MIEGISYYFFKRRLKKKLERLYEIEDPWGSSLLSESFAPWIQDQIEKLDPLLRKRPVLDAGGGEGHFYTKLRAFLKEYHLLDIKAKALRRARERFGETACRYFHQSLDEYRPASSSYGMIWLFSILNYLGGRHHPRIFQRTLETLWKALAPGGLVLLIHPYYSGTEKKEVVGYGNLFLGFGGRLSSDEDIPLGKQSFIFQAIQK